MQNIISVLNAKGIKLKEGLDIKDTDSWIEYLTNLLSIGAITKEEFQRFIRLIMDKKRLEDELAVKEVIRILQSD